MELDPSTVVSGDMLTLRVTRSEDGDVTLADFDHTLFVDNDSTSLDTTLSEHDIVEADCLITKAIWAQAGGKHMLFVEVESCSVPESNPSESDEQEETEHDDQIAEQVRTQSSKPSVEPQTPADGSTENPDAESKTATKATANETTGPTSTDDSSLDTGKDQDLTVQPVEWDPTHPLRPEVLKRILNHGERVPDPARTDELTYTEQNAIEVGELLMDLATELAVSAAVCYRAGEFYAEAMRRDLIQGNSKTATVGAAFRIASLLEEEHRPLNGVESALTNALAEDVTVSALSHQERKLLSELDVNATIILIQPQKYLPYLARNLGLNEDAPIIQKANSIASQADLNGGTSPWSITAAAVYAAGLQDGAEKLNQRDVADAAHLTEVTIRNNYQKLLDD